MRIPWRHGSLPFSEASCRHLFRQASDRFDNQSRFVELDYVAALLGYDQFSSGAQSCKFRLERLPGLLISTLDVGRDSPPLGERCGLAVAENDEGCLT